jgi:hypothetical protein
MPPAIGMAIAGIASAGAGIYGAKKQSSAAKRADQIAQQSNADQLAYLREQSVEDRRRYDEQQGQSAAQYNAHEQMRAPYRAASAAILGRTMGMQVPSYSPATIGAYAGSLPTQRPQIPQPGTVGAMLTQRKG